MFDIEQISEWRGQDVLDPRDNKVGRLEEIYHDKHASTPGFACVKTGLLGRRLSFVPLTGASMARDHVRVAYMADQIKRAPSAEPDGMLTAQEESALFDHYGLQGPIDPAANSPRLVRYQTDAVAAEVAQARRLVAEQGVVADTRVAACASARCRRPRSDDGARGARRCDRELAGRPQRLGRLRAERLARLARGRDPHDIPGQPGQLEPADHPGRRIGLPPAEAVARRRGEGVMVVVPGLAERRQGEPHQVARLVAGLECPAPEEVA